MCPVKVIFTGAEEVLSHLQAARTVETVRELTFRHTLKVGDGQAWE